MVRLLLALLFTGSLVAAEKGARDFLKKPDAWYATPEARQVAEAILTYQTEAGGWPKNTDTVSQPYRGDRAKLQPTFDNGATLDELRFLARACLAKPEATYQAAFGRGLAYILRAQYPNGGWPQFFPLRKGYYDRITFNDNAMVRVMEFVREVAREKTYTFVDPKVRVACQSAFDRGIDCILKCQILVDGQRTVWCAQHDEQTFAPAKARSYELPSFSGSESVGIVRLLMSLEQPSTEVKAAIEGAVRWLDQHKVTGLRIATVDDPKAPKGKDRVLLPDAQAPALWAAIYDLKSGQPYVSDRAGIPKPKLADLGYERRNGYSWFGEYARDLLTRDYPDWQRRR